MDGVPHPPTRTLVVGILLLLLAGVLGAAVLLRGSGPFAIDAWWNTLLVDLDSPVVHGLGRVLGVLGGVWVSIVLVTLGGAAALVAVGRRWAALYLVAAQLVSAVAVQVLKHLFGRARPEEILVLSDYGSFPSGHTAAAATVAVVATVVFGRWWVGALGACWIVVMGLSRTSVHAHWLSDVLGGALVGAGAALVVAAAFAPPPPLPSAPLPRRPVL
ncbi:phosphatase PAP2 family protein [Microbacterium sp. SORGH_AS_0888]|uniref:phosphatase PAP2 family protein n=1 Tax=Microbacterium sp. SORGH_AS_0888 TaxID=3041791 RepID=UPI0027834B89|nr:phosphatase PAP2 family protein [Microbacterium sp. SORGH_AS_0888]MDQ1130785.1 membrane-associated phospholipid phosphatase [Microbacterium sp. SORGH_AS_0888]